MNIKRKENNFLFNKYLPSNIIRLFLFLAMLINIFLTANAMLLIVLLVFSVVLSIIYIWLTELWKTIDLYIYIFLLLLTFYYGLLFVFLTTMLILYLVYLVFILFYSENKTLFTHIIILNLFFLSVSFLIFKYFLLGEIITYKDLFVDFNVNWDSKISLSFRILIYYNNVNNPLIIHSSHPLYSFNGTSLVLNTDKCLPIILNEKWCLKFINQSPDEYEFIAAGYFYFLSLFMESFSPFLKVILFIY